ncbi:hypothetical protein PRK78_004743 [Emydomyces testavorans]|uniref:Uncharacterized protein n=1 Tax=Emydomyces testavorans TaxID=2070801 RepID=A0AAF0DIB1_9EURO|nr:hypothetical protein PRK78_004743 [Emydomyces testavorans]
MPHKVPFFMCAFLALLIQSVTSQIAGCADVGCPAAQEPLVTHECQFGNATFNAIGIARVDSKITPDPLTWTLGVQAVNDSAHPQNTNWTLQRNFYLGTPPSLDLRQNKTYGGCVLVFNGIAPRLAFTSADSRNWTCSSAMNSKCVDDLRSLARTEVDRVVKNATTEICSALGTALQGNVPQSCARLFGSKSWGNIISKGRLQMPMHLAPMFLSAHKHLQGITGPTYPAAIQEGKCHPTTGKEYKLSFIASYEDHTAPLIKDMSRVVDSVTPLMTVFYPVNGTSSAPATLLKDSEAALSCLRPVLYRNEKSPTAKTGDAPTLKARLAFLSVLILTTVQGLF